MSSSWRVRFAMLLWFAHAIACQGMFVEFQSIPTNGALGWTSFSMDGVQHLAVANYHNGLSHNVNSKVYRWDDATSSFLEFQSIPTNGAHGWTSFSMDGIQYLAVANYHNGLSRNVNSTVYRWDDATSSFLDFQSIPTNGALIWTSFSMDGIQYLAVANYHNGLSHNVNSKVYRWDDATSSFLDFQSIPTNGALGWTSFSMDGIQYLAVANHYNGLSKNVNSKVYRWDDATSSFLEFQSIPTNGARGWTSFSMDGIQYLAVANHYNGLSNNVNSKVYRWETTTTATATATTTATATATTTRTEAPSSLAATEFAFVDVGAWSLAILGGYVVALWVPIFLAKLWKEAGARGSLPAREPQTLGSSMEQAGPEDPGTFRGSVAPPGTAAPQGPAAGSDPAMQSQELSLAGSMKRSRYILAAHMLLESGNLISTMLYAVEAYQRSTLVGLSVPCGSGTLVPLRSSGCPSMTENLELPLCLSTLSVNTVCEADAEVSTNDCLVLNELDNCGDYDVYTLERPACGAIGCAALSHVLWVSALISFGATVGWTAVFYARCLQERQAQQRALWHKHFMALFACLGFLLLTAVVVGFAGGSGAVLVMAFLCPLLPVCLWVLAAWLAFLPATGEEAVVNQAAALEIPFFNVFLALQLAEAGVEELHTFRGPLNMGLRVFEDIPELIIGLLDLVYFGGAWYTWLGIGMSMALMVFQLLMGVSLTCRQLAMDIAQKRLVDTE